MTVQRQVNNNGLA